jgi:hypothetical protein
MKLRRSLVLLVASVALVGSACGTLDTDSEPGSPPTNETQSELSTGTGLKAEYFNNKDLTALVTTRTDPTINFYWTGSPVSGVAPDSFSVRWTGRIEPRYSQTYTFSTVSDDGVRLWVNGQQLVNNWTDHSYTENTGTPIALVAGQPVDIRMEYYDNTYSGSAKLYWRSASQPKEIVPARQLYPTAGTTTPPPTTNPPPATPSPVGTGTGLRGEYFDNQDLTALKGSRTDGTVNFNWGTGIPFTGVGADTFSVRWSGEVQPRYSGTWTFSTFSDDGVRLTVNGQPLVNNWTPHSGTENSGSLTLEAGKKYSLVMEYFEASGDAIATLSWAHANQPKQIIPQTQLYPASGTTSPPPTTNPPPTTPPPATPAGWLSTSGNKILKSDGTPFRGRGANVPDTRSCDACTWQAPNVNEVKRRIDELVGTWKANFLRLDLESYASSGGRVHWNTVMNDAAYLADIQEIVRHIGTKPGVYVLLSLWQDPTLDANGWPTAATNETWKKLAATFKNDAHVMYGIANEPMQNYDGALDSQVWSRMNSAVQAIRDVEAANGTPSHLIAVQGTGGWGRFLDYYLTHPITAGGGRNVVYETHVYNPASDFQRLFITPSRTLPVIIGEFGEYSGVMTQADVQTLMQQAEANGVSYLAWTFHMRCSPNLIQDQSGGGCGVNMPLTPTALGNLLKNRLATPW